VSEEFVLSIWVLFQREKDLGEDGTNFSGCRSNAMSGRAVAGRKRLAWNDKCGRIWPTVLKEIGETVEHNEASDFMQ
jgi:hypothetical protein